MVVSRAAGNPEPHDHTPEPQSYALKRRSGLCQGPGMSHIALLRHHGRIADDGLETVDLDGLGVQLQALLLVNQELLHILTLVALQLDHLSHCLLYTSPSPRD